MKFADTKVQLGIGETDLIRSTPDFAGIAIIADGGRSKDGRYLALPLTRIRRSGEYQLLSDLGQAGRDAVISAALAAADSLRAKDGRIWAIAQNGTTSQTQRHQCHVHIHIGVLNGEGLKLDKEGKTLLNKIPGGLRDLDQPWLIHRVGDSVPAVYHFHQVTEVGSSTQAAQTAVFALLPTPDNTATSARCIDPSTQDYWRPS